SAKMTPSDGPIQRIGRKESDRIKVAYVSADFREHPVGNLLPGLIESHDRARFETLAISLGPEDSSATRERLKGAFERFIDVREESDRGIAELMRKLEIDIAVDLGGHTDEARPDIFAYRPAPLQVGFLGYPGTLGADHMD